MKPTAALIALAALAAVAGCGAGKEPAAERESPPAAVRAAAGRQRHDGVPHARGGNARATR